jgi:UDP-N-acetylmuramate--alanine ligase
VTNIDADHMQTYGQDFGRLQQAFVDFLHRLPFYGTAVLCSDDAALSAIASQVHCRVCTYGLAAEAQVRAVDMRAVNGQMHFRVQRGTLPTLDIVLNLCGEHNVRNALAAIAVAMTLGIPDAAVQTALRAFDGVERRFERYGEHHLPTGGSMAVVDDYGHHPTEIAATLAAARGAFAGRRLVLAFQPQRYTRTQGCFADFVAVLALADAVLLAEVYGAGEAPIAGADSSALGQALQASSGSVPAFVGAVADMAAAAIAKARDGDVLLCMGAGSIGVLAGQVVARLRATQQAQAVA